jgi:nitrous oxidase accessory protein NosD
VSYTLRGRIESRLGAAALPFLAAVLLSGILETWWPLELVGLMVGAGLVLDPLYHRLLDYQPGWVALPLGLVELGVTMALAYALDVMAPLGPALALFGGSWLVAQVLGHGVFPFVRLTYGEDGGELGRAGVVVAVLGPAAVAGALGVAWTMEPPTVRLAAGVHQGPLVVDPPQKLVGERGAVVRGGIVVTADDVEIRNVVVVGGDVGIDVRGADDVVLDDVTVVGATADGIHARDSSLVVSDCRVHMHGEWTQGIDISFGVDADPSRVEDCTVSGAREGIVSHFAAIDIVANTVSGTALRGITMTEMSMGHIERNDVLGALGTGIFCGDMSHCHIEDNRVAGTSADATSGEKARQGYDILVHYYAWAKLEDNDARKVGTLVGGHIEP